MFDKVKNPGELKMFTNGIDTVIAYSVEDARAVVLEWSGCDDEGAEGDGWRELDPDGKFTLELVDVFPDAIPVGLPPNARILAKAPVRDWIAKHGRCFFASTEW